MHFKFFVEIWIGRILDKFVSNFTFVTKPAFASGR